MTTQQGFLIFHFKIEDDAHLIIENELYMCRERPLSSNHNTLILFLTRIKYQKWLHRFVSKGYLFPFGMKRA